MGAEKTVWEGRPSWWLLPSELAFFALSQATPLSVGLWLLMLTADSLQTRVAIFVVRLLLIASSGRALWRVLKLLYYVFGTQAKLTTTAFEIRSGLLGVSYETIPLHTVIDISLEQPLFARLWGFGEIVVYANDFTSKGARLRGLTAPYALLVQFRTTWHDAIRFSGAAA